MTAIAIIDDDVSLLKNFKKFINSYPDTYCLVTATDIRDFNTYKKYFNKIDLLFLDITLYAESSIPEIPKLMKMLPNAEIIMLTVSDSSDDLIKSINLGASGYIIKTQSLFEIRKQIDIFLEGGAALSPEMAKKLIMYHQPLKEILRNENYKMLKDKHGVILGLLSEGYTYEEIANKLGTSINNIRYYIKTIYKLLNTDNKIEAVKKFQDIKKNGILST